jgi:hypothetical protein
VNEPSGLIGTTCFTAAEALSPHWRKCEWETILNLVEPAPYP